MGWSIWPWEVTRRERWAWTAGSPEYFIHQREWKKAGTHRIKLGNRLGIEINTVGTFNGERWQESFVARTNPDISGHAIGTARPRFLEKPPNAATPIGGRRRSGSRGHQFNVSKKPDKTRQNPTTYLCRELIETKVDKK
jgi:hypothetical protein